MDEVGRLTWSIVLLSLLLILSFFFYTCEIAIVSIPEHRLKKLIDERKKNNAKAKKILSIKQNATKFILRTNMIGTLCVCAGIAVGTNVLSTLIKPIFSNESLPSLAGWYISYIISFFICAFVFLVLGHLLPKRLASHYPENVAFLFVGPFTILISLFTPFIVICAVATRAIMRLFSLDPDKESSEVTEEEIRMMIDAGNESGSIEETEKEMLYNIFEFDDKTAVEIMTHRTNVVAVEKNQSLSDITFIAINEGFSRIPVYEDNIDNIIGIINVKDLLCLVGNEHAKSYNISHFLRKVIYIPGTSKCGALLREFKQKKVHVAVVVDEYGGTNGIVTMEDLLESIVGNIEDEYDFEDPQVTQIDENTYILDGSINVDELEDLLSINLPNSDDGDTLAGVILNTIGYIPSQTQRPSVTLEGFVFTVLSVNERRIEKVKAEKLNVPSEVLE